VKISSIAPLRFVMTIDYKANTSSNIKNHMLVKKHCYAVGCLLTR